MLISSLHGTVLENTTKCRVTFNLLHTTLPIMTSILAYTFVGKSFCGVNQKLKRFLFCFCFVLLCLLLFLFLFFVFCFCFVCGGCGGVWVGVGVCVCVGGVCVCVCVCVCLFSIPSHIIMKLSGGAKSWAYRCVPGRENPLFYAYAYRIHACVIHFIFIPTARPQGR